MFCGVFVIFLAMRQRSELLERQHRERMAMIERGQIPLPDPDGSPRGRAASSRVAVAWHHRGRPGPGADDDHQRRRRDADVGIGIGGAIVILGASFIVRSFVVRPESQNSSLPPPPPPRRRLRPGARRRITPAINQLTGFPIRTDKTLGGDRVWLDSAPI